ncbi:hydroxymethylbilane synthase [Dongia mobilis]|uniref:Porphobilinogen deaminase n=1 Tax=Dongia mobilis TaxID=578943 RepID=A0A4R6WUA7_9PROT|nr:hydroxymethylbilane synthase [Dongia mobilis]TDQ83979.1 hydroxymethylbilane synthase [Dongia mobilis]
MAGSQAGINQGQDRDLRIVRIGTRGSPLALAQAEMVQAAIAAAHPALPPAEIVVIKTTGDRIQDRALAEIGGKGLFTKEIEDALLAGSIDVAVHSMKDVPTQLPDGLAITCLLPREDPRDALILRAGRSLADLPPGAVIGSASLRRQAQLLHRRPDLRVINFRGNVGTRLGKLAAGEVDATLLALAGLKRLGKADVATCILETGEMLPAVAQGAIGLEIRAADTRLNDLLKPLHDDATAIAVTAERACLAGLEGSCRTPIAAHATIGADGRLRLVALIAKPDGSALHRDERSGLPAEAAALGRAAADRLKSLAGPDFLA